MIASVNFSVAIARRSSPGSLRSFDAGLVIRIQLAFMNDDVGDPDTGSIIDIVVDDVISLSCEIIFCNT